VSDHKIHAAYVAFWIAFMVLVGFACGCATVKPCLQPITAQAINDGAAVLVCANNGKTLAACEQAQLAVETGQVLDDLMCGEAAVVNASKGAHAAP
jgi:hypothetical protein